MSNVDCKTRLYNSVFIRTPRKCDIYSFLLILGYTFYSGRRAGDIIRCESSVFCSHYKPHSSWACMGYIVMRHSYHINTVQIRGFQHRQWWMSFLSRSCTLRSVASKVENFSSRWLAMWSLPSRASLVFARCSFMLHGMKNHKQTRKEVKFEQFPQMLTSNRAKCPNFRFIFVPEPRLNQMSRQMCAGKYWKWHRLAGSCFHSAC